MFSWSREASTQTNTASLAQGYAVAYERNPEGFRADATLFETWSRAMALGSQALESGPAGNWVHSSLDVNGSTENRLDPWNHAFCMLRRENMLVVVSAAPSSPLCKDVQIQAEELSQLPHGRLLESPSGSLILVIERKETQR